MTPHPQPHKLFCAAQIRCEQCGYFNPYTCDDDSEGECWRFPHHENIDRPKAHSCAEGKMFWDDRASHSSAQSEQVSIIQDEDGYIEERKIMQPCFGHEYEEGGFFCEHCKDKKECWVKMETGVIPTFIKPSESDYSVTEMQLRSKQGEQK